MELTDEQIAAQLEPLRQSVKEQGDLVRSLKESSAAELDIKKAVNELKARKKLLEDSELKLNKINNPAANFDKSKLEDLLKRRFFIDISFAIYGGIAGQYDFGPMGCGMKTNLINYWRRHFILEENLLEVDCTSLTPEPVLKASGHVDRFADLMVKDEKTGECFRLDHLIKAHLQKLMSDKKCTADAKKEYEDVIVRLDGFTKDEMNEVLRKYAIKSPTTGNEVSDAIEFNLMFSTSIGPTGTVKGFLRPETAQGIFVNFKRLLEFNNGKLPFGAAQVGNAFRNEISPRSGIIRVREFTMAEIEYFIDPSDKSSPKFDSVKDLEVNIYSACSQSAGESMRKMTIGDAVGQKIIANEILGYFMARIYLFLIKIGIDPKRLRFRQHMSNEMAHYACDCWDAETLTSYGWLECVGCADRSCYDLNQHAKATNTRLVAEKPLKRSVTVDMIEAIPQKAVIGKTHKTDAKGIMEALAALDQPVLKKMEADLTQDADFDLQVGDKVISISKTMVMIKRVQKTRFVEEFVPSVIEPSFGIGRIMYSIWEHNFRMREGDEARTYLSLAPIIAPIKCSVLPLSGNDDFVPFLRRVADNLREKDLSHRIDDSAGSIGRRYARTDEVGIPFGITVDFDTLKEPHTVTLRERDSMDQVRLPIDDIGEVVSKLCTNRMEWSTVVDKYPKFEQQETTAKSN